MDEQRDSTGDEIVTRALRALRAGAADDGPPPELVTKTVQALRESGDLPEEDLLQRIRAMPFSTKVATLAAMTAMVLAAYLGIAGFGGTSVALADVAERLRAAKTMSFEMRMYPAKPDKTQKPDEPIARSKLWHMQPDKFRADIEHKMGKASLIVDPAAGKTMVVSPQAKIAIIGQFKAGEADFQTSMVDQLRELAENKNAKPLGERQIDGVTCQGFESKKGDKKFTIWANAKTGDPVQTEFPVIAMPPPFGEVRTVLNNFKLDDPLDPAMFSVEPPEGYMVIKSPGILDLDAKPSDRIVKILREYAKHTEGQFPDRLDDWGKAAMEKLSEGKEKADFPMVQLSQEIMALNTYFLGHDAGKDYQYLPGAKLGDKERIVFWYRDKKKDKLFAVWGDLRVGEVTQDQLPAEPK